jgi:pSer/pThr/pTyr-binding forkhead associated (FHA) protein
LVTIGRSIDNTLALLDDAKLSRYQARISRDADSFFVEDLNSVNGTFVNGDRVSGKRSIVPGDTIQLGSRYLSIKAG